MRESVKLREIAARVVPIGADAVMQHWYDHSFTASCPATCSAEGVKQESRPLYRALCRPEQSCRDALHTVDGKRMFGRTSEGQVDFFFTSELRLPVLHALGYLSWVWHAHPRALGLGSRDESARAAVEGGFVAVSGIATRGACAKSESFAAGIERIQKTRGARSLSNGYRLGDYSRAMARGDKLFCSSASLRRLFRSWPGSILGRLALRKEVRHLWQFPLLATHNRVYTPRRCLRQLLSLSSGVAPARVQPELLLASRGTTGGGGLDQDVRVRAAPRKNSRCAPAVGRRLPLQHGAVRCGEQGASQPRCVGQDG